MYFTVLPRLIQQTSVPEYHSVYQNMGVENDFNFEEFKKNFKIVRFVTLI